MARPREPPPFAEAKLRSAARRCLCFAVRTKPHMLTAARALVAAAVLYPGTVLSATVVVQRLFTGGDGLAVHDPNGTTFEASGLVCVKGVTLAFAAMGCSGKTKHSSVTCPAPLSAFGSSLVALRRSTDSAKTFGPLIFVNTTVSLAPDETVILLTSPLYRC